MCEKCALVTLHKQRRNQPGGPLKNNLPPFDKIRPLAFKRVIRKIKLKLNLKRRSTDITRIRCSVFYNFKVITLSGVARGVGKNGGMLPRVQALKAHQHTLFRHIKTSFSAEI